MAMWRQARGVDHRTRGLPASFAGATHFSASEADLLPTPQFTAARRF